MPAYFKNYFVMLTPTKFKKPNDGKFIVKFGLTRNMDVMKRFDPSKDSRWKDFEVKTLWSNKADNENYALSMEKYILESVLPKKEYKVWLEKYLIDCPNNYYDNFGATEFRVVNESTRKKLTSQLYDILSEKDKMFKQAWKDKNL